MKIGILTTGYPPEDTIDKHGSYANAFERLLEGHGFQFANWNCLEGEFPETANDAEGWLITGSKFGAYEDLPWISTLEDFIRNVYSKDIPIVGICFGHQVIAQALGGKVEKFDGGWSVGRVEYKLDGHTDACICMAVKLVFNSPDRPATVELLDFSTERLCYDLVTETDANDRNIFAVDVANKIFQGADPWQVFISAEL